MDLARSPRGRHLDTLRDPAQELKLWWLDLLGQAASDYRLYMPVATSNPTHLTSHSDAC